MKPKEERKGTYRCPVNFQEFLQNKGKNKYKDMCAMLKFYITVVRNIQRNVKSGTKITKKLSS